ncbi:MAG: prenylated flavin chaperone LpdD [Syntrophales bacterium]
MIGVNMDSFDISEKNGAFEVAAHVMPVGGDMLVVLTGGRAHIGAVAIAQPRPGIGDPSRIGSTSSVFTLVGHKEDVIARSMSEELSRKLDRVVTVVAGIHWDGLTQRDIAMVVELCGTIGKMIIAEAVKR